MDSTATTAPTSPATWETTAEGNPTNRVSCTCGWAKRVASDYEADIRLDSHDLAHRRVSAS